MRSELKNWVLRALHSIPSNMGVPPKLVQGPRKSGAEGAEAPLFCSNNVPNGSERNVKEKKVKK